MLFVLSYTLLLVILTIFSYGFVDANFPLKTIPMLYNLVHFHRLLTTIIYIIVVALLFGFYGWVLWLVKKKKLTSREIWRLIGITVVILFFSFPAFSYDIFNYVMTAKLVTLYHENPYLVMPIEFLGDPMLAFMHLANMTTPYPPFWIMFTLIPSFLAKGNILMNIFLFKLLIVAFYLGLVSLIGKINRQGIVFFAFNPLVLIEVLVSGHNDIAMMFFALLGFYLFFHKRKILSLVSLLVSAGIKYVTIVLLPLFVLFPRLKKEKLVSLSGWLLFSAFLLSPLKRELYPWYLIWVFPLAALMADNKLFFWLTIAFSFGLLGRYLPFLYTRSWGGITPMVKMWVTIIPPVVVLLIFSLKQVFLKKKFLRR